MLWLWWLQASAILCIGTWNTNEWAKKKHTRTKKECVYIYERNPPSKQLPHTGNFIMDFITSTLSPQLLQHNASVLHNMFRCLCMSIKAGLNYTTENTEHIERIVAKKAFTERAANQRHETLDYYVVQHNVKWVAPGIFIITRVTLLLGFKLRTSKTMSK